MLGPVLTLLFAVFACAEEERALPDRPPEPEPEPVREPEREPEPEPEPFEMAPVAECDPLRVPAERTLRVAKDVAFARAGGAAITMDLYAPRGDGVHPAVLLFHGGGWRRGEKAHVASMARALAAQGFVGVAVDFRLADAPRVVFPAPIADARCAVRWLREHGRAHGVDPERIGAVGFSSGGHMAAMLATAADVEGLDDRGCLASRDVSPTIGAAAVWYAPLDLRTRIGRYSSRPHIVNLLGEEPERAPDRTALASPITHVDPGDAPMVLVHGTKDLTVDVAQSIAMRDALTAARVPVVYAELEGAGHGFGLLNNDPVNRPGICTTLAFLQRTLLGQPATD